MIAVREPNRGSDEDRAGECIEYMHGPYRERAVPAMRRPATQLRGDSRGLAARSRDAAVHAA